MKRLKYEKVVRKKTEKLDVLGGSTQREGDFVTHYCHDADKEVKLR